MRHRISSVLTSKALLSASFIFAQGLFGQAQAQAVKGIKTQERPTNMAGTLMAKRLFFQAHTGLVSGSKTLRWPKTEAEIPLANGMATTDVEEFVNSFGEQMYFAPTKVHEFRFAMLEKDKIYLVVSSGTRFAWDRDVIIPADGRYQYTRLHADMGDLLAFEIVDLRGDGIHELVLGNTVMGYSGTSTDPISWYSIVEFHNGLPEESCRQFSDVCRGIELGRLNFLAPFYERIYPGRGIRDSLQMAQIEFVRQKVARSALGIENAGLKEALIWSKSDNWEFQLLSIKALREILAPAAQERLRELAESKNKAVSDSAKFALAGLPSGK